MGLTSWAKFSRPFGTSRGVFPQPSGDRVALLKFRGNGAGMQSYFFHAPLLDLFRVRRRIRLTVR
jgi:hypothetical protein